MTSRFFLAAAFAIGCLSVGATERPKSTKTIPESRILETRSLQESSSLHRGRLLDALKAASDGQPFAVRLVGRNEENLGLKGQDRDFFYLTGWREPDAAFLYLFDGKRGDGILFIPERDPAAERWTGPKMGPGGQDAAGQPDADKRAVLAATGFERVEPASSLESTLARFLHWHEDAILWLPLPALDPDEPLTPAHELVEKWRPRFPGLQARNLDDVLHPLRLVKDRWELDQLRESIRITCLAQNRVMSHFQPGWGEWQAEATLEHAFRFEGADNVDGFPAIVGSGPNSCILHYGVNNRRTQDQEMMVLDIGANMNLYSADVTRTIPTGARFTDRQREIYSIVLKAQEAGFAAVKPGATLRTVHEAAKKVIADAGYAEYFFHGTSHFLGLDVHDVGGGRDTKLEPGMVLTVEPGIYLAAENLGVRIEDDLLVTATGYELLSSDAPRTLEEIERIRTRACPVVNASLPTLEPAHLGPANECTNKPAAGVTLSAEETCEIEVLAARCEPADACLCECIATGAGRGIGGGCWHICFAYTDFEWQPPAGWYDCDRFALPSAAAVPSGPILKDSSEK